MNRALPLALLLLSPAAFAAAGPELEPIVADLEGRSRRYAAGGVKTDAELPDRLELLRSRLETFGRGLGPADPRLADVSRLSGATARLKDRASRDGMRLAEIARDLDHHLEQVRRLDRGPAASGVGPAVPAPVFSVAPQLRERGQAALRLLDGAASQPFAFVHDGLNASPPVAAAPAPRRLASSPAPPGVPAAPDPALVPAPLRAGSAERVRVTAAQNDLNLWRRAAGYRVIGVDGDYGSGTADAVRIFQRDNGLVQTGVIDAETAATLSRAAAAYRARAGRFVQLGDDGGTVAAVQQLINRVRGRRVLREDGDFGGMTQRAVTAFQRANHLPPTGHVDEETLAALEREAGGQPEISIASPGRARLPPGPVPDLYTSRRMPPDVSGYVAEAEKEFGIAPNLFRAVVWAEGGAVGNSSVARGPAQITRDGSWSCRELGYTWPQIRDDKKANIRCGAYIFAHRNTEVDPPLRADASPLIVASLYNTKATHWSRISQSNKVPPFTETSQYVTRISRIYCQWTGIRLLDPNTHLYPKLLGVSRAADLVMDDEIDEEGRQPRPDCSPYPRGQNTTGRP